MIVIEAPINRKNDISIMPPVRPRRALVFGENSVMKGLHGEGFNI